MFIFERERERQRESRGGAEREEDTESKAGSRLWAVSTEPSMGLKLMNYEIMTWAEVGHLTHWATQVPPASGIPMTSDNLKLETTFEAT